MLQHTRKVKPGECHERGQPLTQPARKAPNSSNKRPDGSKLEWGDSNKSIAPSLHMQKRDIIHTPLKRDIVQLAGCVVEQVQPAWGEHTSFAGAIQGGAPHDAGV